MSPARLSTVFLAALLGMAALPPGTVLASDGAGPAADPVGKAPCIHPLPDERDPEASDVAACDAMLDAGIEDVALKSAVRIVRGNFRWNSSGDWDRAVVDLVASEIDDGGLPLAARYLRATTWLQMGLWHRAISEYSAVIEARPDCGECLHWRAISYLEAGMSAPALADLEAARTAGVPDLDERIEETRKALGN